MKLWRVDRRASDFKPDEQTDIEVAEVWASIEPQSGKEETQGTRPAGMEAHKISFRWGPTLAGISSGWWLTKGDRKFAITSVANVSERNRECQVMAVEET